MHQAPCPLCGDPFSPIYHTDPRQTYHKCATCRLVFVPQLFHVSQQDEKALYDHHQNSPDDDRYRQFLNRLFEPVATRISAGSLGLDFGSGPGPTLSVMFTEAGHSVSIYDPYYAPETSPLSEQYDFVTASEVVEHFCEPLRSWQQMWDCVKHGGVLGIMTKFAPDDDMFANWHYKQDPTHVSFYCIETFEWLAKRWHAELTVIGKEVALFQAQ